MVFRGGWGQKKAEKSAKKLLEICFCFLNVLFVFFGKTFFQSHVFYLPRDRCEKQERAVLLHMLCCIK